MINFVIEEAKIFTEDFLNNLKTHLEEQERRKEEEAEKQKAEKEAAELAAEKEETAE